MSIKCLNFIKGSILPLKCSKYVTLQHDENEQQQRHVKKFWLIFHPGIRGFKSKQTKNVQI